MSISAECPLILGSASPRRRDILEQLGIPFRVRVADVNEVRWEDEGVDGYLHRIVQDKLRAAGAGGTGGCAGILVADTIVTLENEIIGKPRDVAEAEILLGRLAGRRHVVMTRFALASSNAVLVERTVCSSVTMRSASPQVLRRYAESGEGLDKAGAYAVQGLGSFLVERIDGSWTNVVGLPACEVVVEMLACGLLDEFPLVHRSD